MCGQTLLFIVIAKCAILTAAATATADGNDNDVLPWCSSPSSIGQHVDTYCAVNPPVRDRRPSLSSGVCLELSAIERQDSLVFERASRRPPNSSVQGIVWWSDM